MCLVGRHGHHVNYSIIFSANWRNISSLFRSACSDRLRSEMSFPKTETPVAFPSTIMGFNDSSKMRSSAREYSPRKGPSLRARS